MWKALVSLQRSMLVVKGGISFSVRINAENENPI